MILQCFDYINGQLQTNLRNLNCSLLDKGVAENYIPTKAKSEMVLYYDGEDSFEYDEGASAFNSDVKGGLIFFNENLSDEKSNREKIQKLESIKEQISGLNPNEYADLVRLTGIDELEKVNNFSRTRLTFNFKLQNV